MKILIPNGTSPKNVGDQAILLGLLQLLQQNIPDATIILHSTQPELHNPEQFGRIEPTLYSWAVFSDYRTLPRLFRVSCLLLSYATHSLFNFSVGPKKLHQLINDYTQADLIFFSSGGYFRSQPGLTQTLNLFMTLLQFAYARTSKAKKIVGPVSFGPFAHKWQERWAARILRTMDVVSTREPISQEKLLCYVPQAVASHDFALLSDLKQTPMSEQDMLVGFTIRQWFNPAKQAQLEKEFAEGMAVFARQNNVQIQPIVQVDSPQFGDVDAAVTERVNKLLRMAGAFVLPTQKIVSVEDTQSFYNPLALLVGMRMHSNILAALAGTPFVALSYEYKAEGITQTLGMEQFCLSAKELTQTNLADLLNTAYRQRRKLQKQLNNSIAGIHSVEQQLWKNILQTHAY